MNNLERQTWSLRIEHWYHKELSALCHEDAAINQELRRRAVESLGLTEYQKRLAALGHELERSKQDTRRLEMAKESLFNDTFASFGWVNDYRPHTVAMEIELLIGRRELELQDDVLRKSPLAERYNKLREEKRHREQIVYELLEQLATDLQQSDAKDRC